MWVRQEYLRIHTLSQMLPPKEKITKFDFIKMKNLKKLRCN